MGRSVAREFMSPATTKNPSHVRLHQFAAARLPGAGSFDVTRATLARWTQTTENRLHEICESYNQSVDAQFWFRRAPTVAGVPFILVERRA